MRRFLRYLAAEMDNVARIVLEAVQHFLLETRPPDPTTTTKHGANDSAKGSNSPKRPKSAQDVLQTA
jgi:hypothetical protein